MLNFQYFEPGDGFHKPIYTLRQAITLYANILRLKNFSKVGPERKMALRPTFSLYEI